MYDRRVQPAPLPHQDELDLYVPRRTGWRFSVAATGGLDGTAFARYQTPEDGLGLHHGVAPAFQLDYVVTRVG